MENKYFSNIITFLLLTLISVKVSSFHEYTHQDSDDIENCKICELATENQDNEFLIATPLVIKTPTFIDYAYEPKVCYKLVLPSSSLQARFFGRPPPQVN